MTLLNTSLIRRYILFLVATMLSISAIATEYVDDETFKIANQSNADTQYLLGLTYFEGEDVRQDYDQAFKWFTKAADQGNADAQNRLGTMYYNGLGVRQDYDKAVEWYIKAANQGSPSARYIVDRMYEKNKDTERRKFEKIEQAAKQGDAEAQHDLGWKYFGGGMFVPEDQKEAFKWFARSANQGYVHSEHMTGVMYKYGLGVYKDHKEAFKWFTKAADQDNALSQYVLGTMYNEGVGVSKNHSIAKEWFGKSCDNGSSNGCKKFKSLNQ